MTSPEIRPVSRTVRTTLGAAILQLGGLTLGIILLIWCIRTALDRPGTRTELERLGSAPWWQLAALIALSLLIIAVDGLMFRAVLRPVARLGALKMIAVSGVCSLLLYLPFKASMIFRLVYHTRQDHLPLLTVFAWIIATGILVLLSVVPIAGATLIRPQADALWWGLSGASAILLAIITHGVCRITVSIGALRPLEQPAPQSPPEDTSRLHALSWHEKLKDAARMLADGRAFTEGLALRLAIVALQALRFALAARIIGAAVTPEQALIAGAAYSLLQALAPAGVAGVREAGAAGALSLLSGPDILAVTLTVSAAELVANLVAALPGAIYLRVDRLLLARR